MTELSTSFDWDLRAYSLENFADDHRSTLPCVVQTVEGLFPVLEEDSLENGQILILHEIRQEQFVVLTHPNGAEFCIPLTCPVKVELVPLDRLNEEYNTVDTLFMAQPDYFRVLDDMPSLDIKSGSVMKICSRQNGVYHLECEAVGQSLCQQIVKFPLSYHGRFQPLHDAREYLLEDVLNRFPPPSKMGIRLMNSSSTGSLPFAPDTQLPWGSGLRVQKVFQGDTIIATPAGDGGKEVLLFPKTLDVSVVPALDSRAKCEELVTLGQTSALDCLVEQVMKFNSLRAYDRSCRVRRFRIEDLTALPSNELHGILTNVHETPIPQTIVSQGEQEDEKKSILDPASIEGQKRETWLRKPFCPAVWTITPPTTNSVSLQGFSRPEDRTQLNEKRHGRVGLESFGRWPSESDLLDRHLGDLSSEEADNEYEEVLSDVANSAPPPPHWQKKKKHRWRRQAFSRRLAKVENQVDCTNETRTTLTLPLGLKSLSESDLYGQVVESEGDDYLDKKKTDDVNPLSPPQDSVKEISNPIPLPRRVTKQSDKSTSNPIRLPPRVPKQSHKQTSNPIPLPHRVSKQSHNLTSNPIPLPRRVSKQSHNSICNPIPLPPRVPKQSHNSTSKPIPLPPRAPKQSHNSTSNPIPLPPRVHKHSDKVVSNPIPLPPRGRWPNAGSPVGIEKCVRDSLSPNFHSYSGVSLTPPLSPQSPDGCDFSRGMSSDIDKDGYSKISENILVEGISLAKEDGYSTVYKQRRMEEDGNSRIYDNCSTGSLSSDEEENGYSKISSYVKESHYAEVDNKVYGNFGTLRECTAAEFEKTLPEIKSDGTREFKEVLGRRASYWYAYQHIVLRQSYLLGQKSDSYVNCPLLRARRRQHSDSTTDEMKPLEENNREDGATCVQGHQTFLIRKSRSEGDIFQNALPPIESSDLDSDYYIELLPDVVHDEDDYLEPVDAFLGAAESQLDSPDANYKGVRIGEEGQERHEGRMSRVSSEEDLEEVYMDVSPLFQGNFVETIWTPMLDEASTHADDQEGDTKESKPIVHIDEQSRDSSKLPENPMFLAKNVKQYSSCIPPVPPRKPSGEGHVVKEGTNLGSIHPYRKSSQYQKEKTEYSVASERSKEHANCTEDEENKDSEDSSNEEYDLSSTTVCNIQIGDPSRQLEDGPGLRTTEKRQRDDGKTTPETDTNQTAFRLQESLAESVPVPNACRSSCSQHERKSLNPGVEKISSNPNVEPPKSSVNIQKKTIQETIIKNQEQVRKNIYFSEPIPQTLPEHDPRVHKRDCEHEFEDYNAIQRRFGSKDKKTLVNVKFEAELSRVIASRAQQAIAISSFAPESSPPSLSTETRPNFSKQSGNHTRNEQSRPKSKKVPVLIPTRNKKLST